MTQRFILPNRRTFCLESETVRYAHAYIFDYVSRHMAGNATAILTCVGLLNWSDRFLLRKEVIQPLVPQRLPCYDFIPITNHTFGTCLYKVISSVTSGAINFHDVTGGVYKARERIQCAVADTHLLAIPTSRSRIADYDPN